MARTMASDCIPLADGMALAPRSLPICCYLWTGTSSSRYTANRSRRSTDGHQLHASRNHHRASASPAVSDDRTSNASFHRATLARPCVSSPLPEHGGRDRAADRRRESPCRRRCDAGHRNAAARGPCGGRHTTPGSHPRGTAATVRTSASLRHPRPSESEAWCRLGPPCARYRHLHY